MSQSLVPICIPDDAEDLVSFLTSEVWPFHVNSRLDQAKVRSWIADGEFLSGNCATFWIKDEGAKAGFIRVFDLEDIGDGYPLFDMRIKSDSRGKGIGKVAIENFLMFMFEKYPDLDRVSGTTRSDNIAMRRLFKAMGFVKEGHYRKDWPGQNGEVYDTVKYSILRSDWISGNFTPVDWDDE